jgi:hypothetical protein
MRWLQVQTRTVELVETSPVGEAEESLPKELVTGNTLDCELKERTLRFGVSVATMNDLRRYPRVPSPKGTILAWQSASSRQVSRLANLSLFGLYIRTTEPPPTGTVIQLLLNVPAGEVRARAVVQRSEPKRGMGVKLVAMRQEDRARFTGWLRRLSSQNKVAPAN